MFTPHILLKLNLTSGEQHSDVERESARTKHKFRVDCGRVGGIGKLGILLTHTHFPDARSGHWVTSLVLNSQCWQMPRCSLRRCFTVCIERTIRYNHAVCGKSVSGNALIGN